MNGLGIVFSIIASTLLLTLPRHKASFPLLLGTCYITLGQGIAIGSLNFPVLRILIAIGIGRLIIRGERITGQINRIDVLMISWACWSLISSIFHVDIPAVLINRLGMVYNSCGIYFLIRASCQTLDDVIKLSRFVALLLIPLAIEMVIEQATGRNLFSFLGGVPEFSSVRNNRIRAQGPFAHSILAGTVGAVCLPIMVGLWQKYKKTAILGIATCFIMIITSASSGPLMSAIFAILSMLMWYLRRQMRLFRWLAIVTYVGLDVVMKAPAYYLIARIDLTGSSTSWHRAALIEAAIEHISEWWFAGTDFTRHWLAYGVEWSDNHIDITNHYIVMGVSGGLILMFLFIFILAKSFSIVGQIVIRTEKNHRYNQNLFMVWCLGSSLFVHAATFISVSYFDQTFVFLYLVIAMISSCLNDWQVDKHDINKIIPHAKTIVSKYSLYKNTAIKNSESIYK